MEYAKEDEALVPFVRPSSPPPYTHIWHSPHLVLRTRVDYKALPHAASPPPYTHAISLTWSCVLGLITKPYLMRPHPPPCTQAISLTWSCVLGLITKRFSPAMKPTRTPATAFSNGMSMRGGGGVHDEGRGRGGTKR